MTKLLILFLFVGCAHQVLDVAPKRDLKFKEGIRLFPRQGDVPIPLEDLVANKKYVDRVSAQINLLHNSCRGGLNSLPTRTFPWRPGFEGEGEVIRYIDAQLAEYEPKHWRQLRAAVRHYVGVCQMRNRGGKNEE